MKELWRNNGENKTKYEGIMKKYEGKMKKISTASPACDWKPIWTLTSRRMARMDRISRRETCHYTVTLILKAKK